jgi:hypothetical protein
VKIESSTELRRIIAGIDMSIKFSDIVDLFEIANFGSPYEHQGYICKVTGKTYIYSEFGDNEEELPDDIHSEKYLMIPDKNDLDLGRDLAFVFTQEVLPSEYENVRAIFRHKGAYFKFKALLESSEKLEEWYQFERNQTENALRRWCSDQDVEING